MARPPELPSDNIAVQDISRPFGKPVPRGEDKHIKTGEKFHKGLIWDIQENLINTLGSKPHSFS
ncbi:hypothetical protein E2562_007560 [Oryza meyeriana var. granulata]|uniref:Uncharacterized protein n=1 Tax=Oryza meyeriana var. granulata TaxID=110450 RepID=A0A6G1DVN5_9ORYZ|nr:hypothetical protein E2562_007560 [Oryza meyeriana var. granulata]